MKMFRILLLPMLLALVACDQTEAPADEKKTAIQTDMQSVQIKRAGAVGPWEISKVYRNDRLERCSATLHGSDGALTVSLDKDGKSFQYRLPAVDGLERGSRVSMDDQFDDGKRYTTEVTIDAADGTAYVNVPLENGWVYHFIGLFDLDTHGELRNSRDYRIWLGGQAMTWQLTHTSYVIDTLNQCVGAPLLMDRVPFPQTAGMLRNLFTGEDQCLLAGDDGQVAIAACSEQDSVWVPVLSGPPGFYHLKQHLSQSTRCLSLHESNGELSMQACDASDNQNWWFRLLRPEQGYSHQRGTNVYVQIHNMISGTEFCLDVMEDGKNKQVKMVPCAEHLGQAWISNTPNDMQW